jgi:site-specific DNA recombinase
MARSKPLCRSPHRVVLYARVSTLEQAEKDLSLPAQLSAMREDAKRRGFEIEKEYIEPGASGTDDNRKVFQQMIAEVGNAASDVSHILVFHSSRFMRNVAKASVYKERLRKAGVRVLAIRQETSDDPSGHLLETVHQAIDQYESEVNGERTSAAMRQCAEQGYFPGGIAPYGFAKKKVVHGSVERAVLVHDPREADVVREMFRLYIAGSGGKSVARHLNQRGLYNRSGKPWSKISVLKVIEQPALAGTYHWGRLERHGGNDDGAVLIAVEPIVAREIYDAAQRVRAQKDPVVNPGRTASSPMLLAGLVRCAKCGASYQLETSGKKSRTADFQYRYYNCRSATRAGKEKCEGCRIPEATLDRAVLTHIAERLFTEDRCRKLLADLSERAAATRSKSVDERARLKRELADVERRIGRWELAFEDGTLDPRDGGDRIRQLRQRRTDLQRLLAVPAEVDPPARLYTKASVQAFQGRLRALLLGDDHSIARTYLRFLVEGIEIRDHEVTVLARPEAAVRMMSGQEPAAGEVLTSPDAFSHYGMSWLRRRDSNPRPGG